MLDWNLTAPTHKYSRIFGFHARNCSLRYMGAGVHLCIRTVYPRPDWWQTQESIFSKNKPHTWNTRDIGASNGSYSQDTLALVYQVGSPKRAKILYEFKNGVSFTSSLSEEVSLRKAAAGTFPSRCNGYLKWRRTPLIPAAIAPRHGVVL